MNGTHPMNDARQCRATNRQGNQCGRAAIIGGHVCNLHGGKTPIAITNARARLDALVDPALTKLAALVNDDTTPDAVKLAAIRDILDRTGYKPPTQIEVISRDSLEREYERLIAEQ